MKNETLKAVLDELSLYGIKPDIENGKKHLRVFWLWQGRKLHATVHRTPCREWHAPMNARAQIRRKLAGVER